MNTAVITNNEITTADLIAENNMQAKAYGFMDTLASIRHFLPLLSIAGAGLMAIGVEVLAIIGIIFALVGFISAMTVCPLKLMAFPVKCIVKGFKICRGFIPVYGVADFTAAVMGTILGFCFGMAVIIFLPAIFTIKKYYQKDEEELY